MAAGLLEHLCPDNIILLVKARLQFNQYRDLLAVIRRLRECLDNRRIAAHAVQRLLDGEHIRILCRFLNEVHDRVKGLVGVT